MALQPSSEQLSTKASLDVSYTLSQIEQERSVVAANNGMAARNEHAIGSELGCGGTVTRRETERETRHAHVHRHARP